MKKMRDTVNFNERTTVWDGLGIDVRGSRSAEEMLTKAGLDWQVGQKAIFTSEGIPVNGYKANVRLSDQRVLGLVSDKYKLVQNQEAFSFSEELLRYGFSYQYAGIFQNGRKTWVLVKIPDQYIINGERICTYLVILNSHDASSSFKIAITPVRMLCSNMLNLALSRAQRVWNFKHSSNITTKVQDAMETIEKSEEYMEQLGMQIERLNGISLNEEDIRRNIEILIPVPENATPLQEQNVKKQRQEMWTRYEQAPDLQHVGHNAYRFINAVSDFETHGKPLRQTATYRENLFERSLDGNRLVDKAMRLVA